MLHPKAKVYQYLPHNDSEPSDIILDPAICQKIWETKKWPKMWTQSLVIPLRKKGNSSSQAMSEINSHSSKILLQVIFNRLKAKAEELLAEEEAGFRPGLKQPCARITCSAGVHIRIASAIAPMATLNRIWWCNTISSASQCKLYKSLVTSILLYLSTDPAC